MFVGGLPKVTQVALSFKVMSCEATFGSAALRGRISVCF